MRVIPDLIQRGVTCKPAGLLQQGRPAVGTGFSPLIGMSDLPGSWRGERVASLEPFVQRGLEEPPVGADSPGRDDRPFRQLDDRLSGNAEIIRGLFQRENVVRR